MSNKEVFKFLPNVCTKIDLWKFMFCVMYKTLLTQYCAGGKIKKNEMGRACCVYGGEERCAQGSGWET